MTQGTPPTSSDAVDLLQTLVAIPSPSGQEAEASGQLVAWMANHGFDACVDQVGNAVGRRGQGPRQIVLLSHIDTFPGTLPVHRQGDWLYGRGTVDAKGSLCAFAAAAALAEMLPEWQVIVVGAVEEEAASSRGARHLLATGLRPDCCVIGEPSNWDRITLGYKGRLLVNLRWSMPFSHSAGPARLPAEQAVDLWNVITAHCAALNAERRGAFDRVDPSLRHIASHDEGAYGTVEMSMGFRLPPGLEPEALAADVRRLLKKNGLEPPEPDGLDRQGISQLVTEPADVMECSPVTGEDYLRFSGGELAFRSHKNTSLVRAFLPAIRAQGGKPRFVLKTGTSDMNVVGPAWNVPIVAYGPGDSALDHTPQERISLPEYLQSIEVLKNVLHTLQRSTP